MFTPSFVIYVFQNWSTKMILKVPRSGGVRDLLRLPVTYSVVGFLETVWDLETLVGKLSQILYDYFYMATSMIVVYSVKLLWSLSQ